MSRLATLIPLAAIVVLAGCGSSSSSSTTNSTPPASTGAASSGSPSNSGASSVSLSEREFKITPAQAKVSSGGTVTITVKNTGKITHALAVQTPSGTVSTSSIAPGASATLNVKAAKSGRYTFFCPIGNHRQLGMQGTLVVGSGATAATSSTSSTRTSSSSNGYAY